MIGTIGGGTPEINGAIDRTEHLRRKTEIGPPSPFHKSSFIAPKAGQHSAQGDVYLDGRKVGKVLYPTMASLMGKDAGRNISASGFDGGMGLQNPAYAGIG